MSYTEKFERAFPVILKREGGWNDHTVEGDNGGRTFAGISTNAHPDSAVWRFLEIGELENAQLEVKRVYFDQYWKPLRCEDIEPHSLAERVFGCGVLSGIHVAATLLQEVIDKAGDMPIVVDGVIGSKTVAALDGIVRQMFGPYVVESLFLIARLDRYLKIVEADPTQIKFLKGWQRRVLREYE